MQQDTAPLKLSQKSAKDTCTCTCLCKYQICYIRRTLHNDMSVRQGGRLAGHYISF